MRSNARLVVVDRSPRPGDGGPPRRAPRHLPGRLRSVRSSSMASSVSRVTLRSSIDPERKTSGGCWSSAKSSYTTSHHPDLTARHPRRPSPRRYCLWPRCSASSARLSSSTFTAARRRTRAAVLRCGRRRDAGRRPRSCCRSRATRGTWKSAAAGEMCGSKPDADVVTRSIGTGSVRVLLARGLDIGLDRVDQLLVRRTEIGARRVRGVVPRARRRRPGRK